MKPFNNELQVGQPAMVINVEKPENIGNIGMVVTVLDLMSLEESKEYFLLFRDDEVKHAYALISAESINVTAAIRQDYLMPLPPIGDVYDQEVSEDLESLKVIA